MAQNSRLVCQDCGRQLSSSEIFVNDKMEKVSPRIDLCEICWVSYVNYELTGE